MTHRKLRWSSKHDSECMHCWHEVGPGMYVVCCWCEKRVDQWWEASSALHGPYLPQEVLLRR